MPLYSQQSTVTLFILPAVHMNFDCLIMIIQYLILFQTEGSTEDLSSYERWVNAAGENKPMIYNNVYLKYYMYMKHNV